MSDRSAQKGPRTSRAIGAGSGTRRTRETTAKTVPAEAGEAKRAHLTGRAAILAVVMCAIALSLAYPIREYIAQSREIAGLKVQQHVAQQQVGQLARQKQRLGDKSYIRREARRRLHMCDPNKSCYVVLNNGGSSDQETGRGRPAVVAPWYVTLWRSVDAAGRRR